MKIFANILVVIIFLLSTTGVLVSKHYCGDKLISISFFSDAKKCCDDSCPFCKNENKVFKVNTKIVPTEIINLNTNNNLTSTIDFQIIKISTQNLFLEKKYSIVNSPPGEKNNKIIISKLRL